MRMQKPKGTHEMVGEILGLVKEHTVKDTAAIIRRLDRIEKVLAAVRVTVTEGEQRHLPWFDLNRHKMAQVQRVFECFRTHCKEEGYTFNRAVDRAYVADPLGFKCRASLKSWCYRNRVESFA